MALFYIHLSYYGRQVIYPPKWLASGQLNCLSMMGWIEQHSHSQVKASPQIATQLSQAHWHSLPSNTDGESAQVWRTLATP